MQTVVRHHFYNTGKLDRDIGCLVLSDTEEYWGYGLLSDPHPSNLVSTVLYGAIIVV